MKNKNICLQWLSGWKAIILLGLAIPVPGYSQVHPDNEPTAKKLTEEARVLILDSLDYNSSYDKLVRANSLIQGSRDSALLMDILYLQAKCLHKKGKPQEALDLLEQVLGYWQVPDGMQNEKMGDACYLQGYCRMDMKMYAQARQSMEEALSIFRKNAGEYYFKTASTLNLLGVLILHEKDWDEALPYFRQATRIYSTIPPHLYATYPYYNLGLYYSNQRNFPEAIKNFEKSLAIREQFLPHDHRDIYLVLRMLAFCNSESGHLDKAVQLDLRGLKIAEKQFGVNSSEYALICLQLSFYSWSLEMDLPGGIKYAEKAIEIYENIGYGNSGDCATAYNHLAICHQMQGNLDKALLYHEKALNIRIQLFGENDCNNTFGSINNIALCYGTMGQTEKALLYYKRALDIRLNYCEKYHPYTGLIYNNIGDCYRLLGKSDEALENFALSNEIYSSPQVEGYFQSYYPSRNLGWFYFYQRDYNSALFYFNKAVSTARKVYTPTSPIVANLLLCIAQVKTAQKDYETAHLLVDSTLKAIKFCGDINQALSKFTLIDAWQQEAEIFRQQYLSTRQISLLHESKKYSKKALDLSYSIALDFSESMSKNEVIRNNYSNYERAIWVETELDRLQGGLSEASFAFAEYSRSLSLYQSIRESQALHFAGIPDSVLSQERRMREEMTHLDKMRQEKLNAGTEETDTCVLALSNQFLGIKLRYDALSTQLEKDYPEYYQLKYKIGTTGIRYLQDTLLRSGQSLLEYFVGDSAIYIFTVTRKKFDIREVKLDFPLEKWVAALRRGLYSYHVAHKNFSVLPDSIILQFSEPAHQLYLKLVAPVEHLLTDEVVIIPDGVLGYLPFDVLLKDPVVSPPSSRFHTYHYFGNDFIVSYCYSATMLREMNDKLHKTHPDFCVLAMAPFACNSEQSLSDISGSATDMISFKKDTLTALFYSSKEVTAISDIFNGKVLLGANADKEAFLKNAGRCSILHLNTHGKADDKVGDYAWLGFSRPGDSLAFDKLYVKDIYNLSLNADLVVLSACETGIGELKRGEGIISLARAFAFAGAKSIVTSLWSVDDKSTGELMQLFYQNIQKGLRKDKAMWRAKKDFLAANKGTKYAHPFFWAGFIPIGDMAPVQQD